MRAAHVDLRSFRVDGPTVISFSGGRTSGLLLWMALQAGGGTLPPDAVVMFANTGREDEATLRFVRECGDRWCVPITWVEWRDDEAGYAVVDFDTASRDGEPFEALIRKRQYLPNPVTRFCTSELKIRAMGRHLRSLGWYEGEGWDTMLGIRADEPRRVAKIRARGRSTESAKETMCLPLVEAGIGAADVAAFWRAQPFDLQLPNIGGRTMHGNCDLCFLKPVAQRLSLISERPERALWWARMESSGFGDGRGARFRKDEPGYAALAAFAEAQGDMWGSEEEPIPCFCGD